MRRFVEISVWALSIFIISFIYGTFLSPGVLINSKLAILDIALLYVVFPLILLLLGLLSGTSILNRVCCSLSGVFAYLITPLIQSRVTSISLLVHSSPETTSYTLLSALLATVVAITFLGVITLIEFSTKK